MASATSSRPRGLPAHPRDSIWAKPRHSELSLGNGHGPDPRSSRLQHLPQTRSRSVSPLPIEEPSNRDYIDLRSDEAPTASPRSSYEKRRIVAGQLWRDPALPSPQRSTSASAELETTANSRRAPPASPPPPAIPPRSPRRQSTQTTPTMDSRRSSFASSVYVTPMSTAPSPLDKGKGRESPTTPVNGRRSAASSGAASVSMLSMASSSSASTSTSSSTLDDLPPLPTKSPPRSNPVWRGDRAASMASTVDTRWSQASEPLSRSGPMRSEEAWRGDVFGADGKRTASMARMLDEQADRFAESASPVSDASIRIIDRPSHRRVRSDSSPPQTPNHALRPITRPLTSPPTLRLSSPPSARLRRVTTPPTLAGQARIHTPPPRSPTSPHRVNASPPPPPSLPPLIIGQAITTSEDDDTLMPSPTSNVRRRNRLPSLPEIRARHSSLVSETPPELADDSRSSSAATLSSMYATPEATPELAATLVDEEKVLPPSPISPPVITEGAKRRRTRARAIQELVSTEWTYAQDLAIARDVYYARAQGVPLGEIASHLSTSTDFVPPPTPMMTAHSFAPLSPAMSRRSFAPSPALASVVSFAPPNTSSTSLSASMSGPSPMTPLDIKTVFINLPELTEFAAAFSGVLDDAAGSSADVDAIDAQDDRIGDEFLRMIPRIAQLYSVYCARHGAALQRLEALEPSLVEYTSECQQLCRSLTHSWSLGSLLIKPVQRCLKYPLLIETILANTAAEHPDRPNLESALEKMLGVAQELNEAKRRNEVVGRVVKKKGVGHAGGKKANGSTSSFSQAVSKKLLRTGHRAKQAVGVDGRATPTVEDAEEAILLDVLIAQLASQQRDLDRLQVDLRTWIASVRNVFARQASLLHTWAATYAALPGEAELEGGGQDLIMAFLRAIEAVQSGPLADLISRISYTVLPLIARFDIMYAGPQAVIAKRSAKRVDYDRSRSKSSSATDRAAQEGAQAYLSLSRTLAEELPVFLGIVARALDGVVAELAGTQADFWGKTRSVLAVFERTHCNKFAGAENLVTAWWALAQPLMAALDGLPCASSKRLMRQVEATTAASNSWRSSTASHNSTSSAPAAIRAGSVPTISLESLIADPAYGDRGRRATADAAMPSTSLASVSRSNLTSWLRRGSTRPPTPTTPDPELSSTRRFFHSSTSTNGSTSSVRAPSPSPPLPSAAHAMMATATATAAGIGQAGNFELERVVAIPVHHRAKALYEANGDMLIDGKATLALAPGEHVGVLWEEGDGWVWARHEQSSAEGYVRAQVLESVRPLPPGAGV